MFESNDVYIIENRTESFTDIIYFVYIRFQQFPKFGRRELLLGYNNYTDYIPEVL